MKGYDAFAGVIKSGGKTRRAAKMVILDADHPDVLDFIDSKANEEKKAWALIEQGYDPSFTGEAYGIVFFQNANHSVRVTDEFMQAVEHDADWTTHEVTDGAAGRARYKAREIFRRDGRCRRICAATRASSTTPRSTTGTRSANTDRIYATQPVLRVHVPQRHGVQPRVAEPHEVRRSEDGEFDVEAFRFAAKVTITAQEILVDNASYPTPKIEENSHRFRPLGMGYANLGALLMSRGLAYDSDEGRNYAAALTAIMHGEALPPERRSSRATTAAPFVEYATNEEPFLRVIGKHRDAAYEIPDAGVPERDARGRRRTSATTCSSSAGSTATATRRSPCSRPPAPSRS